jgi:phenylacetate-CoA ligase
VSLTPSLPSEAVYGLMRPVKELPFLTRALLRPRSLTREEVLAYQSRQLRRLVAHAYAEVPYYRELFDAHGVRPENVRGIADLPLIPVTTKSQLQRRSPADVVPRGIDPEKLRVTRTSGSTGEPAAIRRASVERLPARALRLAVLHDLGLRARDCVAILRSRPSGKSFGLKIFNRLGLYHRQHIDCLQPPERIAHAIEACRPDVVMGFPTVLWRVAQVVRRNGWARHAPRFILTYGEVLTAPMRHDIAEAFSSPVRQTYPSVELGTVAWECISEGTYHTADAGLIVEVLKDGRAALPGERGVLVGTALHRFAMPFIRYQLGDVVTRGEEPCRCGRPFGSIASIQGRMVDYFLLPGGRFVHAYEVVKVLVQDVAGWIRQYQLLQERPDHITLRIVPWTALSADQLATVHAAVGAILGGGVKLQVVVTSEIPLEASGKFRPSRSLVYSPYDGLEWSDSRVQPRESARV